MSKEAPAILYWRHFQFGDKPGYPYSGERISDSFKYIREDLVQIPNEQRRRELFEKVALGLLNSGFALRLNAKGFSAPTVLEISEMTEAILSASEEFAKKGAR